MNNADANEAAYAAQEAIVAAAEAKQLASEQELDYNVQEIASTAVSSADEAQYAAYMAEQYQAAAEHRQQQKRKQHASRQKQKQRMQHSSRHRHLSSRIRTGAVIRHSRKHRHRPQQRIQRQHRITQQVIPQQHRTTRQVMRQQHQITAQVMLPLLRRTGTGDDKRQHRYTTGDTTGSTKRQTALHHRSDYTGDVPQSNASSSDSLRQSVVNYALQFVGNPYVYGGTSLTNGTDCSGFTQSVLANFGISISRTAASQSGGGTAVDMSNLQPGDLLFYDNGSGIGHVSMYIGNGQVVHASNEQTGIIVSSVDYRTACAARSYF